MDIQQFQKIIQNGINHGAVIPDKNVYSSSALSTNSGLYTALNVFLNSIITTLDNVRDLGNEIGTEDEKSAQLSKQHFIKILHSDTLKQLSKTTDSQPRKKLLKVLLSAKNFFYTVNDKANPSYHNPKCRALILKYDNHTEYIDNVDVENFLNAQHLVNSKEMQAKQVDKFTQQLIQNALDEIDETKPEVEKVLGKYGLKLGDNNYKLTVNPKRSDYMTSPRVVSINNIKFFYNPKDVSMQQILNYNIPNLPNDQDAFLVTGVTHGAIEEY